MATQMTVPAKTLVGTWSRAKAARKEDGSYLSNLLPNAKSQPLFVFQVP